MRFLPSVFSIALFTSAFLSFSVQPILGKMLLPMVGGAPASWIVAMAFFQLALLAGYGISYLLSRFNPWVHAAGLLVLYAFGAPFLPPVMPTVSGDAQGIALSIEVIKALFQTIFVPFLALTATTAALQRVFAATTDPTAKDPYYLFIASNAGSFAGLFVYPFILEPLTGVAWQSQMWMDIYGLAIGFIVFACLVAWRHKAKPVAVKKEKTARTLIAPKQVLTWMMLAFIPCSLSMGVTTLITTDVGGLPLFWVIPLGLYLLTFIFAFSPKEFLRKKNADFYHVSAGTFMVLFLGLEIGFQPTGDFMIFFFLSILLLCIFFFSAWACHQKLADSRPEAQHLTLFYFVVALGGALAGVLHAFVIPFTLNTAIEFPIMVILSLFVVRQDVFIKKKNASKNKDAFFRWLFVTAAVFLIISFCLRMHHLPRYVYNVFTFVFLFVTLFMSVRPRYLAILGALALITSMQGHYPGNVLEVSRNFFGARAIYDVSVSGHPVRVFTHGNTMHGMEQLDEKDMRHLDSSYYVHGGPIDDVLKINPTKTMAVIGLGAGQVACFKGGVTIDYYEIDKDVETAARKYFDYLSKCPVRDVIIGDGRIMIQKQNRKYDVILVDAFSSDGIPLHLITREAIDVYKNQLNKNGILLFHISNRYLNLGPPLAAIGQAEHLVAYHKSHVPPQRTVTKQASSWFAFSIDPNSAKKFEKMGWATVQPQSYVWTDDRSSMLSAIAWSGEDAMLTKPKK